MAHAIYRHHNSFPFPTPIFTFQIHFHLSKKTKMAWRAFYNEVKTLKVKELPAHLKPYFTVSYVKNSVKRGVDNYHAKYIETSSADPIYHICFGGMALSYLIALPEERRHLEHQQQHGGGH